MRRMHCVASKRTEDLTATRKSRDNWLGYYCKVIGFEVHGGADRPALVLQLELLESVPKVTSVKFTIYCQRLDEIEKRDVPSPVAGRWHVSPELGLDSLVSRRSGGLVDVVTWWSPLGVIALLNVLLTGRQVYVSFDALKFYRNRTKVTGIGWYTKGAWLADVVGEESDLY